MTFGSVIRRKDEMIEFKIQFPAENTFHALEFDGNWQDWGYAPDHEQNWKDACVIVDAFVENAPKNGLVLRLAVGSIETNLYDEGLCFSELYMVLQNGVNHFAFNTLEMSVEKPMHMDRIRQIYFGGWAESGKVRFSITAPGIGNGISMWQCMGSGNLIGRLDENKLNVSVLHTLQTTNRDVMSSIHRTRDEELLRTFGKCPKEAFCNGLELGAGDCYQSHKISTYVKKYLCTDINPLGFSAEEGSKVMYDALDAERVGEQFLPETFDFVYSSSLLEHLPNPQKAVSGIYKVLQEGGVFICILPNPFWRILNTILFPYSEYLYYLQKKSFENVFVCWNKPNEYNNNVKRPPKVRRKKLLPDPHGISETRWEELFAFSAHRWKKLFRQAGFKIVRTKRGPVSSGLGLGHTKIKQLMEFLGFSTVNIYILAKGDSKRAEHCF